jgi:aspartyl-tRNA(Asn)/glutamyl-tRNA(Gln) amidotransferase subunit C
MSREEEIRKNAKKIMDEFIKALEKVKSVNEEVGFEAEEDARKPKGGKVDVDFKKKFLKNAPKSKDDFIVAEKKRW